MQGLQTHTHTRLSHHTHAPRQFGATAESWDAIPEEKDPWYTLLHNAVLRGQELGAPLQGALFWCVRARVCVNVRVRVC